MLSFTKEIIATILLPFSVFVSAQSVDYSVVSVPEEAGIEFVKLTQPGDYVALPIVHHSGAKVDWLTNRIIDISPDGKIIAYLSKRAGSTNIFLKNIDKQGSSIQRTQRNAVLDFKFSPDGEKILFSEARGKENQIFL